MEIIIEEISRGHKLIGRHKFLQQTINIGRGYNNDVIMTDPHICPKHLSIHFDGENWIINDLESINGSFLEKNKQPADQHIIRSGDVVSIGKSQIRFLLPEHPVAESITFSPFESLIDFARNPVSLMFSIGLFAFVAGYIFYLNKPLEVNFTQLLVPAIGMTLLFALWPCTIAFISHLSKSDARVMSQVGISFAFFNLMWISDVIEKIVDFNLSGNWPFAWLITLLPIGLAFCLFWLNFYIGFHMSQQRRLTVAASLTALLFGGSFLIQLSTQPEFSSRPNYNATLMTPAFSFAKSANVDEFIDDTERLFVKAQKLAKED
ncbi:FHA domain-containing protein [Colwelliaceae bacterium 6471]